MGAHQRCRRTLGLAGHARHRRGDRVDDRGRVVLPAPPLLVEPGREPLGRAPGVGEDQRRSMCGDEVHQPALDMRPDGRGCVGGRSVGGCRSGHQVREVRHRDIDRDLQPLVGRRLDDPARRRPGKERGDGRGRAHRRGQPDALGALPGGMLQPLQGQRQVHTALRAGHRVDLVDDDGADPGQGLAGLRRQHQEQRFGGGDQDVGRAGEQGAPLRGLGVPGAHPDGDARDRGPDPVRQLLQAVQRAAQIPLDVHPEGLQRRDVQHPRALSGAVLHQLVDGVQERREGLAAAGRGDDQGVLPVRDGLPRLVLGRCGGREALGEPL